MEPGTVKPIRLFFTVLGVVVVLALIILVGGFFYVMRHAGTQVHDVVIPTTIISATELTGTVEENMYTTNIMFDWNSLDPEFMEQKVSVTVENTGKNDKFNANYRNGGGIDINVAIFIKPAAKAEVFNGRIKDLTENRGIGLNDDKIRAKFSLKFETAQKPEDLSKIVARSYCVLPGS